MMAALNIEQIDHSSGSSADSEGSVEGETVPNETQTIINTSNSLSGLLTDTERKVPSRVFAKQMYSYPVIDMRKTHRIGWLVFHKINCKSTHQKDLKFEASRQFDAKPSMVHVVEEKGRKEEVLLKTIIVILPDVFGESCYNLIIETYESLEEVHPRILCVRLPTEWKMSDAKRLLMEELEWRGLVFCKDGLAIDDDVALKSCDFENLERIQAMQQNTGKIELIYQPRTDVRSLYSLEVDMNKSVKKVKRQFKAHFQDEIEKQDCCKEPTVHFCFQNRLLDDKECIGLVLRRNIKDEKISIHFGSENSILVDLKFKAGRKTMHKVLIVSREISTRSLRGEVSKHLGVDPKAVKLTFEEKLIDEHDNLGQVYRERWCSGCRIAAGVKKCKTLRVRHPTRCEEVPFEMYILEPVLALKRKIAEKWNLDLLQTSLFCRGIRMQSRQLLQHYPIKNNMEIGLSLYEHRIMIKVILLKEKKRIRVFVDNSERSTVDDLLRFCAHSFSYARQCSKGIFKDRCLRRRLTLAEAGIQSDDMVIVAFFDQPYLLQGGLINVFVADMDGHIFKRLGAVNSGVLLHAPKTASVPQTEQACFDNGPIPKGICICDNEDICTSIAVDCRTMSDEKSAFARSEMPAVKKNRKKEFLERARELTRRRKSQLMQKLKLRSLEREEKPSFFLLSSDSETENMSLWSTAAELSLNDETGRKTVRTKEGGMTENQSLDTIGNAETNSLTYLKAPEGSTESSRDMIANTVRGEIESDGPTSDDRLISQRVTCIENCCQKIRGAQAKKKPADKSHEGESEKQSEQPFLQSNCECNDHNIVPPLKTTQHTLAESTVNHDTVQVNKPFKKDNPFHGTNDLSGCETETSGCESSHAYRPNIPVKTLETAVDSDSSSIEHVTSRHGEDCQCRKCLAPVSMAQCPFLRMHLHGFRMRNPRSISESDVPVSELRWYRQRALHPNYTFPVLDMLQFTEPNADIETSGITAPRLDYVAKNVGKKWKELLRKLTVDETEITSLEYQYSSSGLKELGLQGLLSWKQGKGREATLEDLLKALEDIGLKSVAEQCTSVGYTTA